MAAPDCSAMQTLAARLATFEGPRQLAKRRASSSKKKQPNTASWPHKSPSPEQLAEAGFYYKPTPESHDSVTCFLCAKSLDGWEAGDNPAAEHLAHVPDCGWAVNVCIGQRRDDEGRAEEDPMSHDLVDARTATFRDAWPHESKKGWKPKVKKMVEAGWCYNPLPEYDDCVMCFYCGTSLDGWEPKDDPTKEHRKRADECHFFTLVEESKKLKKQSKGKKARGSQASRASAMSTATIDSEQLSFTALEEPPALDESIVSTSSTASRPTRGRPRTARGKAARTTKAAKDAVNEPPTDQDDTQMADAPKSKATRRGRPKAGPAQKIDESVMNMDEPSDVKPTRGAAKRRAVKQKDESLTETSIVSTQQEARPKRGKKRTSDGEEKVESSAIVLENEDPPKPAAKSRTKRAATKKQTQEEAPAVEPASMEYGQEAPVAAVAPELEPVKLAKKKAPARKKESSQRMEAREPLAETTATEEQAPTPPRPMPKAQEIISPSAQSSDAENVPPSARPSSVKRAAMSPEPQPMQTPRTSPSKRNNLMGGGLQTSMPWSSVDLDTILLLSPTSAQAWRPAQMKLDEVIASMGSPEKGMTVEQWILHNAERAEEQLRGECEKMIVTFETEGNRALRAVEGIECT